ncbi:MAG TPA: NAD(P)/FAD-dependent oxidoreductase [Candidatus Gallacutalibacter stercoravium]|nr:NAD(P)/FAD-dependent oxidoreductase [Candidatus Gallacutalibacter stercoravium]
MGNQYDVIVVGAGNAGLAAAATTAQKGLKTLLLERNLLPGGCATSFRRGRFEFEASLHELANVGTTEQNGSIRKLFNSLGARVDWRLENNAFRVITGGEDGYDVTMPSGMDAFCNEMERQVPGSRESVRRVLELVEKVNAAITYLSSGKPDPKVLMREHADFMRMASHSVDECLQALQMPPKAQNIMKTYWPYLGARTSELDFAHYALMMERYIRTYPAMPAMRSHELSLALEKAIRDNGGDVWFNAEVTEILFDGARACGVAVGEDKFYAGHIVLNCFPGTAYTALMEPEFVPERAIKLENARQPGCLFFTVYLGLNRSCEELGVSDYSVFLYESPDASEQYESLNDTEHSFIIANCLNQVVPEASEKGSCMLFLTTMLTQEACGNIRPEEYKKAKNRIAGRLLKTYEEKMGLIIRPHIEEIVIAAPPTFARYLNTPNGTPYGYQIKPWDTIIARTMCSKNERFIDGLSFIGAHAERSDGYSSTYANGRSVGERIVREVKKHG